MADGSALAAVQAAEELGDPLGPADLLAFDPPEIRRLFDSGDIYKVDLTKGQSVRTVILASPPLPEDENAWIDEELRYLDVAYSSGVSFAEMQRALHRSGGEILQKAWSLKLARQSIDRYDDGWGTEIPAWRIARLRGVLDEAYTRGTNPDDNGEDLLAHRSLQRAFERGRREMRADANHQKPWTDQDIETLRRKRGEGKTIPQIARVLRRRQYACTTKASQLGLAVQKAWTEDEDRILVAGVERGLTNREIAPLLPGRSFIAVTQRAAKICGGRAFDPWTPDERAALRRAVENGDNLREFAADIGRGRCGVRYQCKVMGLSHPNAVVPYTETEDLRIRNGWERKEPPRAIAADLGRPVAGVYNRAFKLGITGRGPGRYHGPRIRNFEIGYIRKRVEQGWTARQISKRINRSHHMVYQIAKKNGIAFPKRGPRKRKAA